MDRVNVDTKYGTYRKGRCAKKPVEVLLKSSGVDLSNGGDLEEIK
jgi:hypothetical protein